MNQTQKDQKVYAIAKKFLTNLVIDGNKPITSEILNNYLHESENKPRPDTIAGIYERILLSAQGSERKPKVIGGAIGGIRKLEKLLCNFNPKDIIAKYDGDSKVLLRDIINEFKSLKGINQSQRGLWPQYCKTILSAAEFFAQFETAGEFYSWADFFDRDTKTRPALPMLLGYEIEGIGFPLACDFLKELGYTNFPKPDVHLIKIFKALGLCPEKANAYTVFKSIIRVARNVGVTPYDADKLFWLIGSGNFYNDEHLGKKGRIGGKRQEFIDWAQKELKA